MGYVVISRMHGRHAVLASNPDNWDEVRGNLPLLADEPWFCRPRTLCARLGSLLVDRVQLFANVLATLDRPPPARREQRARRCWARGRDLGQDGSMATSTPTRAYPATKRPRRASVRLGAPVGES